jgi:hypothetical protein
MWPMRVPKWTVAVLILALVASGGAWVAPNALRRGSAQPPAADAPSRAQVPQGLPQEIVVTRDSPTLPSGCSPREVAQLIVRFLDAFDRGDQEQLAGLVFRSPAPGIEPSQWFAVNEDGGRHFAAYDLRTFLAYAAQRRQRHERIRLLAVSVAGPSWHGGADILYTLTRHADGWRTELPWLGRGRQERTAVGKGAIDCANQVIRVWVVTVTRERPRAGESGACPKPPRGAPPAAIVACAGQGS